MNVRYIANATVTIETGQTTVLCDPWLEDGAFYGSWCHYPPVEATLADFSDVDYIFISHIHPDHCHIPTLEKLDTDIPVVIHDFAWDFLGATIERLGFEVIELDHDTPFQLGDDLYINILAADNCDPEACGSFFGCSWVDPSGGIGDSGGTWIDSMAVFDDGEHTVVNVNDCPYDLSAPAARAILDRYDEIDCLLHPYAGSAGAYPQCFANLTHEEKIAARDKKTSDFLGMGINYANLFEPEYLMPYAGEYVLGGHLTDLNQYLAAPERHEAKTFYETDSGMPDGTKPVVLNRMETLDLKDGQLSKPFEPINPEKRSEYIQEELRHREYSFESRPRPSLDDFKDLVPAAFENLTQKRGEIGFESPGTVLLRLVDDTYAKFPMNGEPFEYVDASDVDSSGGYSGVAEDRLVPDDAARADGAPDPYTVEYEVDPRLLEQLLMGPKHAHWNNAELGSHITFHRHPNVYERGLYYCMNFAHV